MKKYINFDTLLGERGGSFKKELVYPLRVGRKQKKAVLDANGVEIVIFERGNEILAQLTCDLLNANHIDGLPWILEQCEKSVDRYIKAEAFIVELSEMNIFQRIFSFSKIIKFFYENKS